MQSTIPRNCGEKYYENRFINELATFENTALRAWRERRLQRVTANP